MKFRAKEEFDKFLNNLSLLDVGSQGISYVNRKNNIVYKVFHDYFEGDYCSFDKEQILKFSFLKNNTFIWPNDVIEVGNQVVGYTTFYKKANNLYRLDPLLVNLNLFELAITKAKTDIKKLCEQKISIYDIMYNILYTRGNFYVIDTFEYSNNLANDKDNYRGFNLEIMYFLVSGYFDDFIKQDRVLSSMYKDKETDSLEFLKEFRKKVSEYMDKPILQLEAAKKLVKKKGSNLYIREIK